MLYVAMVVYEYFTEVTGKALNNLPLKAAIFRETALTLPVKWIKKTRKELFLKKREHL